MDERLDYYSSEEMLKKVSSQWMIGHAASTGSLERDSSRLFLQYKNNHLNLVQKKEIISTRNKIPASKMERMSYYRHYLSSVAKTQILNMQKSNFNYLFWNYVLNVLTKSLPHTYVTMFLASYTPEEHLFIPKMVPLFYGFKFAFLLASFSDLLCYISNMIYLLGYLVQGLTLKNPWNRCKADFFEHAENIRCYNIEDFANKIKNGSWTFKSLYYETLEGEKFHLVQVEYFKLFVNYMPWTLRILYFVIMSLPAVMSNKLVTKKCFWKLLNGAQWSVICIEVLAFINLHLSNWDDDNTMVIATPVSELSYILETADIDMLSESMTAPPVLHVLTARSTQEIKPNLDSAAIITSNAFLFIFRGLLFNKLKDHCQGLVGAPIKLSEFNPYAWFYLWPMFLSTFFLGDLYTIVFLGLNVLIDVLTLAVTYHCFVETVIHEWKFCKRWMITIFMTVCGVITYSLVDFFTYIIFNIYTKALITFAEVVVLYSVYPVGRLVDDITFHTGTPPTRLRVFSLRMMTTFYFISIYNMFISLIYVIHKTRLASEPDNNMHLIWSLAIILIPFVLGTLYITYIYVVKDRAGWQRLFIPVNDWGPKDQSTRKLRKLYDSRYYIGSQATRTLSRYMIKKSESRAYQLDLNYEPNRRSTMPTSMFRMGPEKKKE